MTKSLEDYIEEIHRLILNKQAARVSDVAAGLNVKKPSVVKAIGELKKLGLATQEPYGNIQLTEKGTQVASLVLSRHIKIKAFLKAIGVGEENAERDACLMEHILSAETMDCMVAFQRDKAEVKK